MVTILSKLGMKIKKYMRFVYSIFAFFVYCFLRFLYIVFCNQQGIGRSVLVGYDESFTRIRSRVRLPASVWNVLLMDIDYRSAENYPKPLNTTVCSYFFVEQHNVQQVPGTSTGSGTCTCLLRLFKIVNAPMERRECYLYLYE